MNAPPLVSPDRARFELCFRPLLAEGHSLAFPCDAAGRVDMDALSDAAREIYLYARTVVGCQYSRPVITARG